MISRNRIIVATVLILIFILAGLFGGPTNGIDLAISGSAAELRSGMPALAQMAAGITLLGGMPFTLGAAVIASFYLLLRRQWTAALLLIAFVIGERLLVEELKDWVGRPRPELEILPSSLAYPSGHAANSMTAYLAIALIAFSAPIRRTAAFLAIGISVLIGLTRIIIGVHWPSDVVGGWALGLLVVGLAIVVGERSGDLPEETKHDVVGGHLPPAGEDKSS